MPISEEKALEAFNFVANDPAQPFEISNGCGNRHHLMVGRMLEMGIDLKDIGTAMLFAPPAHLYANPADRPVMCPSSQSDFSFSAVSQGWSIIHSEFGFFPVNGGIEIKLADGTDIPNPHPHLPVATRYTFQNNGEESFWDNHIAPTLQILARDGSIQTLVIDPSYFASPATLQDLKDKQNCPEAIIMTADFTGKLKISADLSSRAIINQIAQGIKNPTQEKMVAVISGIPNGIIGNPYNPPFIKDAFGSPSLEKTTALFATLLAPYRAFQEWMEKHTLQPERTAQTNVNVHPIAKSPPSAEI